MLILAGRFVLICRENACRRQKMNQHGNIVDLFIVSAVEIKGRYIGFNVKYPRDISIELNFL